MIAIETVVIVTLLWLVLTFCTGCELVLHKAAPSPEVVLIKPPDVSAEVRTLRAVAPGEPVYTVSSPIESQDGAHIVGDGTRPVQLFWEDFADPTPVPPEVFFSDDGPLFR